MISMLMFLLSFDSIFGLISHNPASSRGLVLYYCLANYAQGNQLLTAYEIYAAIKDPIPARKKPIAAILYRVMFLLLIDWRYC